MKHVRLHDQLLKQVRSVSRASRELVALPAGKKNSILKTLARGLKQSQASILAGNARDLRMAKRAGLNAAMIDRLRVDHKRIRSMADGVLSVAALKDPVGKVLAKWERPNGLQIEKISVPIGVILIIYESRPNVTVECGALCLKSGNGVILRGGREAFYTNRVLTRCFCEALRRHGVSPAAVSLVQTTDRKAVDFLLCQHQLIQLVIPRGGKSLIQKVVETSTIPVIKHYEGICHVYVDQRADLSKALAIAYNAKMQRPGVCNAMETLLVHQAVAKKFLPVLGKHLRQGGCEIRADRKARRWIPGAQGAKDSDFGREFLDKILAVKVVCDVRQAVEHIARYGSGHTEAIVTEDKNAAEYFVGGVDASSVMVNASTRFSDGFEYGFGAEIGISTDKIHARGPMGMEGLMTYKYVVRGKGHVRI